MARDPSEIASELMNLRWPPDGWRDSATLVHFRDCLARAIADAEQRGFDAGCMHAMSDKMDGRVAAPASPPAADVLQDELSRAHAKAELDAVTIASLQKQRERLTEALEPFAHACWSSCVPDIAIAYGGPMVRVGDYRRAVRALEQQGETNQ